jgi:hypothetical protein
VSWFGQGIFALPCGTGSNAARSWGKPLDDESVMSSETLEPLGDLAFGFESSESQAVTVLLTGSVRLDATDTLLEFHLILDDETMEVVGAVRGDGGVVTVAVTSHKRYLEAGSHTLVARWIAVTGVATAFGGQFNLEAIVAKDGELT